MAALVRTARREGRRHYEYRQCVRSPAGGPARKVAALVSGVRERVWCRQT